MPHHPELLADMSKGIEPWEGDCGDQEGYGEGLSELEFEGERVMERASRDFVEERGKDPAVCHVFMLVCRALF